MSVVENVIIRGVAGLILLFILTRLMGKKQITQLTYFEYIVGISIGGIAAELTFSTDTRMANFITGLLLWSFLAIVISIVSLKSYRFRLLVEGKPTVLIKNGQILENHLKKEKLTVNELMIHLREKNAFNLADVELAIMETSGQISVMKKSELQPLTPKDTGVLVKQEAMPSMVIMDGNVMRKTLKELDYTEEWLLQEIQKHGADDVKGVFIAQIDSKGNVYVDLYRDHITHQETKHKLLALSNIKQLRADLHGFSLKTENAKAKHMYTDYAKQMDQLLGDMSKYLKEDR
jgi:uncharacterized membrane protein YcaP (DUF421 family)